MHLPALLWITALVNACLGEGLKGFTRNERQADNLRYLFNVSRQRIQNKGFNIQHRDHEQLQTTESPPPTSPPREPERDIYSTSRERFKNGNILLRARSRLLLRGEDREESNRGDSGISSRELFSSERQEQRTRINNNFNRRREPEPQNHAPPTNRWTSLRRPTSSSNLPSTFSGQRHRGSNNFRPEDVETNCNCAELRRENQLLREMLNSLQEEQSRNGDGSLSVLQALHSQQDKNRESDLGPLDLLYRSSNIQSGLQDPDALELNPVFNTPLVEFSPVIVSSSYETTVTVDIPREVSVLLNGRKITTEVLDKETRVSFVTETYTSLVEITQTPTILPSLSSSGLPFLGLLLDPNNLNSNQPLLGLRQNQPNLFSSPVQPDPTHTPTLDTFRSLQDLLLKLKLKAQQIKLKQKQIDELSLDTDTIGRPADPESLKIQPTSASAYQTLDRSSDHTDDIPPTSVVILAQSVTPTSDQIQSGGEDLGQEISVSTDDDVSNIEIEIHTEKSLSQSALEKLHMKQQEWQKNQLEQQQEQSNQIQKQQEAQQDQFKQLQLQEEQQKQLKAEQEKIEQQQILEQQRELEEQVKDQFAEIVIDQEVVSDPNEGAVSPSQSASLEDVSPVFASVESPPQLIGSTAAPVFSPSSSTVMVYPTFSTATTAPQTVAPEYIATEKASSSITVESAYVTLPESQDKPVSEQNIVLDVASIDNEAEVTQGQPKVIDDSSAGVANDEGLTVVSVSSSFSVSSSIGNDNEVAEPSEQIK